MAKNTALFKRVNNLKQYDYVRDQMLSSINLSYAILPSFQYLFKIPTAHALLFLEGKPQEALSGVCHSISIGKMFLNDTDSLIYAMIGSALINRNLELFADMLARWPESTALPFNCQTALNKLNKNQSSICSAMRGEVLIQNISDEQTAEAIYKESSIILPKNNRQIVRVSIDYTRRINAWMLLPFCQETIRKQLVNDEKVDTPLILLLDQIPCNNLFNCMVGDMIEDMVAGWPDYTDYQHRIQDTAIALMAAQALLWLRANGAMEKSPTELAALFSRLPPNFNSTVRPLHLDTDKKQLYFRLYARRPNLPDHFPLAVARPN